MGDGNLARRKTPQTLALPLGDEGVAIAIQSQLLGTPFIRAASVCVSSDRLQVVVLPDPLELRRARTGRYSDLLRVTVGEACHRWAPGRPFKWELLPADDPLVQGEVGPTGREDCLTERQRQIWDWLRALYANHSLHLDSIFQLDLGVDSIDWVALCAQIEGSFGAVLSEEAIARIVTVRDLLREAEEAEAAGSGDGTALRNEVRPIPAAYGRYLAALGPFGDGIRLLIYWMVRVAVRNLFKLKIEGIERLPKRRPYAVVINHLSDMDHWVVIAALPYRCLRHAHWAAEATRLFHSAGLRAFSRISRIFPANDYYARWTLACGREVLRRRQVLMWFPEGWRSPSGCLQPFARGVGAVLASQPAPVVPVYLGGTFEAMGRSAHRPRFNMPLRVIVGEPLDPVRLSGDASESEKPTRIVAGLHAAMHALEAEARGEAHPGV